MSDIKLTFVVAICIIVMLVPCAIAAKKQEKKEKSLKIIMMFDGTKEIKEKLDDLSENIEKTAKEFGTTSHVAYWDNEGQNLIQKILHSEGYYNPIVTSIVEEESDKYKNYKITFDIFPANQYKLSSIEIVHTGDSNRDIVLPNIQELPTKLNTPARAESLLKNQSIIYDKIERDNCLLTLSIHNEAIIDHRDDSIAIKYLVKAGQVATIKEVDFKDTTTVNKTFLEKVVSLKAGTCFKISELQRAREKLQATGLFASTTPDIPNKVEQDGTVPVIFKLKERKHRNVTAGLSYGSNLGFGLNAGWKHRNFFSGGEELSAKTFFNEKEQFGSVDYIEPYFLRDDQKLVGNFNADNSTLKAYDSREGKLSLGVEREMIHNIDIGMAGKITVSRIKEKADDKRIKKRGENFLLFSIPAYIKFDKRDSVVDSHKGYYLRGMAEPFYDVNRNGSMFMRNILQARYYMKLGFHKKSVIALKGRIGSILGDNASEIPATERFYLGGSQSLRGYAYQTVGPYDTNRRVPIGGKSFLEGSIEYRFMREDNIGLAVFYDVGNVYRKHVPDYRNNKMFASGGFGLRYNTDFGPIRADIAFPLNRRKGIDDCFQFSFGIGQSF